MIKIIMTRKLTQEEVITNCKAKHGDTYDYSNVKYINCGIKLDIICRVHGPFQQLYHDHKYGHGCDKCGGTYKYTTTEWIEAAKRVHGDKYNYDRVEYKGCDEFVTLGCPTHGWIEQIATYHLQGSGCDACGGTKQLTQDEFVGQCTKIHNGRYDYSLTKYTNMHTKIDIICHVHGIFEQKAYKHKQRRGCRFCNTGGSEGYDTPTFIKKAKKKHGDDKYGYDHIHYINSNIKVNIECKVHGIFAQSPAAHLSGQGCPRCRESKGETNVSKILDRIGLSYERQETFDGLVGLGGRLMRYDFYVPQICLFIEYNGMQHYKAVKQFGGEEEFRKRQIHDKMKKEYAEEHGFFLEIPYTCDTYNKVGRVICTFILAKIDSGEITVSE